MSCQKRRGLLDCDAAQVRRNREVHPPGEVMLVAGNEEVGPGVDGRREHRCIFRRKQNSWRQKSPWDVGDDMGTLEQLSEPRRVPLANAIPLGFIDNIH